VREVHAGHWLEWCPGKETVQRPYWQLEVRPFQGTREDAREQLHSKLVSAVNRRMIADVEVGAFLSGGVDSSLIVALLNRTANVSPKTFSIGFHEASYDERAFARQVAGQYRTDHYEECLDHWNPGQLVNLLLNHVGPVYCHIKCAPS